MAEAGPRGEALVEVLAEALVWAEASASAEVLVWAGASASVEALVWVEVTPTPTAASPPRCRGGGGLRLMQVTMGRLPPTGDMASPTTRPMEQGTGISFPPGSCAYGPENRKE
jgi:hypothetical protein